MRIMNKTFFIFFFLFIPLLFSSKNLFAQTLQIPVDGKWWNGLSAESKFSYVAGYMDGLRDVRVMLEAYGEKKEVVIERDPIKGIHREVGTEETPKQKAVQEMDDYCKFTLEKFTIDQYVSGLDSFYKDKLNLKILVKNGFDVARMVLKGKTKNEINAQIKYLRGDNSPDMK